MKRDFKITARIWIWPGNTPWHFISLDPELSKIIREQYPKAATVKVKASLNADENTNTKTEWQTSLFRNKKDNNYIMPIKKPIRLRTGLQGGDVVEVGIVVL